MCRVFKSATDERSRKDLSTNHTNLRPLLRCCRSEPCVSSSSSLTTKGPLGSHSRSSLCQTWKTWLRPAHAGSHPLPVSNRSAMYFVSLSRLSPERGDKGTDFAFFQMCPTATATRGRRWNLTAAELLSHPVIDNMLQKHGKSSGQVRNGCCGKLCSREEERLAD